MNIAVAIGLVFFAAFALVVLVIIAQNNPGTEYVRSPGGKKITKEYLKDVERLRRKARMEVNRETEAQEQHHPQISNATFPDDLTEHEAALVQKFVAELRREQGISAADGNHAESPSGSAMRKPSARSNPRSFQDWQSGTSGTVREHRTVQ